MATKRKRYKVTRHRQDQIYKGPTDIAIALGEFLNYVVTRKPDLVGGGIHFGDWGMSADRVTDDLLHVSIWDIWPWPRSRERDFDDDGEEYYDFWASIFGLRDAFSKDPGWSARPPHGGQLGQLVVPVYVSANDALHFFDQDPRGHMQVNPVEKSMMSGAGDWWVALHEYLQNWDTLTVNQLELIEVYGGPDTDGGTKIVLTGPDPHDIFDAYMLHTPEGWPGTDYFYLRKRSRWPKPDYIARNGQYVFFLGEDPWHEISVR